MLFSSTTGAPIAVKPGYPSVQIAAVFISEARDKKNAGLSLRHHHLHGPRPERATLLRLAYAFAGPPPALGNTATPTDSLAIA
jgi:hypothetical protein